MAILDDVKTDLRITGTTFNTEISAAIASAKRKMSMVGVERIVDTDSLTAQCIKFYCRYLYNFQGDGERYLKAFLDTASAMSIAEEYKSGEEL